MSNQEPDGYGIYKANTLLRVCLSFGMAEEVAYCDKGPKDFTQFEEWMVYRDSTIRDRKFAPDNEYEIKPVMLIDPQELTRLRAVSEWAKEMWKRLNTIACGMQSPIDSAHADMLCQQYDAITAPEDKEGVI